MTAGLDDMPCISLGKAGAGLNPSYRRLVLVSHQRHLARLDAGDAGSLVVSSDWLLWQKAAAEGWHCMAAEWGLSNWDEAHDEAGDLLIRAGDWVYVDGSDATLFRGASLGKPLVARTVLPQMAIACMERMLGPLIETFRPTEIVYFDYRAEINAVDADTRRTIVRAAARSHGLAFIDNSDPVGPDDPALPFPAEGINAAAVRASLRERAARCLKSALLILYAGVLDAWSRIAQRRAAGRRNALLILNTSLSVPLVRSFAGGPVRPVLTARSQPKNWRFLRHCLKTGILLVSAAAPRLTRSEEAEVRDIVRALERSWSDASASSTSAARAFLQRWFGTEDLFLAMAREVKKAESLFERYAPARVVVDGFRNAPIRVYVDLAHRKGIPVDYVWHSPMVPDRFKLDALGGDSRCPPLISRSLSWGRTNDAWLDAIDAKCSRVRTGSPLARKSRRAARRPATEGGGRVLVLEYNVSSLDLPGPYATKYAYFVDVIRLLRRLGFREIRFKLHPGRPRREYYEAIAAHFGADCPILKHQPLEELLDWADIVIGPVHSGAMPEALAAGRDYYGFLISPTSMDPGFYSGLHVLTDVSQLESALAERRSLNAERVLADLYGLDQAADPCRRFWDAMTDGPDAAGDPDRPPRGAPDRRSVDLGHSQERRPPSPVDGSDVGDRGARR